MSTASPMTTIHTTSTVRLTDAETVRAAMPVGGPDWLIALRQQGADRFSALGLPTRRDEEWRFTSLRPLESLAFDSAPAAGVVSDAELERLAIPGVTGPRVVLIDGRFDAERSDLTGLPEGATVRTLEQAIEAGGSVVESMLGSVADDDDHPFVALNAALMTEGVVVHVPDGVRAEQPIYVLSVTTGGGAGAAPSLLNSRNLIVVGEDAYVEVIEDHAAMSDEAVYLTNAVTEIVVGDRGHAEHVLIERESLAAFNMTALKSRQGAASQVNSHSVLLGGRIVRNDVNPRIEGAGADSQLNGIYVPTGDQHMDNHMRVEHRVAGCTSRQYYRGLLPDRTTGIFSGRIVVSETASETDAVQSCQNLLLSEDARAVTKPQLEIYNPDVKCTHGATTGQLVPEQLFYLRARGVDEATARGLLVYAFAAEGIDRISIEPVRAWVHGQLESRVPYAGDLEGGLAV